MSFAQSYREILSKSEKPGGERNVFDHFIYRKLSTVILLPLRQYRFSPNIITSFSVISSATAAYFLFYSHQRLMLIAGVVVMNISLILDTLDGQYSRLTNQQSEFGGWFDGISDCLKYIFIISESSPGPHLICVVNRGYLHSNILLFPKHHQPILQHECNRMQD